MVLHVFAPLQHENNPRLFEIAGNDHVYYPSEAVINDTVVRVISAQKHPQYVRYVWVNYGNVNVFATNDLPLAPFFLR